MVKDAIISPCGKYRYLLTRTWDSSLPAVCFIGLNPSTADAYEDDPTIRRCIGYGKAWGYGTLLMVNLFGYRATDPERMKAAPYPVGGDNDYYLTMAVDDADITIAAWGNDGNFNGLGDIVKQEHVLHYLKLNKSGQPAHPLYLKKDLKPIPFNT